MRYQRLLARLPHFLAKLRICLWRGFREDASLQAEGAHMNRSTFSLLAVAFPALLWTSPPAEAQSCTPSDTALCLADSRFKVEATYTTTEGGSGSGHAVMRTENTGYFWFFTSGNVEVVVKVLNACNPFNRFWVFAGGLTNVQVVLKVTDTQNGAVRTYANPMSTPFQPIQDAAAFSTCP